MANMTRHTLVITDNDGDSFELQSVDDAEFTGAVARLTTSNQTVYLTADDATALFEFVNNELD